MSIRPRNRVRKRYIEDIPENNTPEIIEHLLHPSYCPHCKKVVEPVVSDAMPGALIGHRTVVFTAILHYFIGVTILKIISIFNVLFYFKLTSGGLIALWHRLAKLFKPWYEEIAESARNSSVLHADETGWRVGGKTCWLWCFTNQDTTYYVIDKSRGSPVVKRFFKQVFKGILITDFGSAYNAVVYAGKQKCLAPLLRELKSVTKKNEKAGKEVGDDGDVWAKLLKRILRDAIRLGGKRSKRATEIFERLRDRMEHRLTLLLERQGKNAETIRLIKRLKKYRNEWLTFWYYDNVPFDNNHAERVIRDGGIKRKNCYCNRSKKDAETQAILMSIFQTLKQRKLNTVKTIIDAIKEKINTKKLPNLPKK